VRRLLITEPQDFCPAALQRLETCFHVDLGPLTQQDLVDRVADYDALFVRLGHRLDRALLMQAGRLVVIVSQTTGLDHIDLEAAREQGIMVLSLKGERTFLDQIRSTAELTWGLLLALARHIPAAYAHVNAGGWDRERFKGVDLAGRTLGVLGYGRLGTMVADYGRAFGMRVLASDLTAEIPTSIEKCTLETLCREVDVLTVHIPSRPENQLLMGHAQFALMKPGALFINTSRGDVMDEAALLAALEEKRLAGAALDVLTEEFARDTRADASIRLRRYAASHDNLLITPHIGGATLDSMHKTETFMAERLLEAMDAMRRLRGKFLDNAAP
jgi:D-3-phosphoglycerate dehydrogenase